MNTKVNKSQRTEKPESHCYVTNAKWARFDTLTFQNDTFLSASIPLNDNKNKVLLKPIFVLEISLSETLSVAT